jgi:hypothetical protein
MAWTSQPTLTIRVKVEIHLGATRRLLNFFSRASRAGKALFIVCS